MTDRDRIQRKTYSLQDDDGPLSPMELKAGLERFEREAKEGSQQFIIELVTAGKTREMEQINKAALRRQGFLDDDYQSLMEKLEVAVDEARERYWRSIQ
jgi:hypothetical protein